ncbi:NAD-binding protein [Salinirubellus salinus]|uniref:NAD-binding protein n=1 Tax=Salinirubellus salinus TaxID=1364945 RepID=A0A9E7R3K2_9EURY|nr:NAD-binding protein [Salinirubellus salinus]UWM54987.1 NAD-binding protein [Salinirubellus salinus]
MATDRRGPSGVSLDGPESGPDRETAASAGSADRSTRRRVSPGVVTTGRRPPPTDRVLVVGGGQVGRRLAEGLAREARVHHLDDDPAAVRDPVDYEASHVPDLTVPEALGATGVGPEHTAVVVTGDDGQNLLVVQHLRGQLGLRHVVVVPADPRNRSVFELPGVAVLCGGTVLADALARGVGVVDSHPPGPP